MKISKEMLKDLKYPRCIEFNEYDEAALSTVTYPDAGNNTIYPALKLSGESGEVADKIGKLWRNHGWIQGSEYSIDTKMEILKELGDVLWYISALARELDCTLEDVANLNIDKLISRKERGVIKGEGDNR